MKRIKYLFIFLLFIGSVIEITAQSASLTPGPGAQLREFTLTDGYIDLALISESFIDDEYNSGDFRLVGAPEGTEIQGLVGSSMTTSSVRINLEYNNDNHDFDTDYTNVTIKINPDELTVSTDSLESAAVTIYADTEGATIEANDGPLGEYLDLEDNELIVTLVNERFKDANYPESTFELRNSPPGLDIDLSESSRTTEGCLIRLDYDLADFDIDYDDFSLWIDGNELLATSNTDSIISDSLTIIAYYENPAVTITPDQALNEVGLGSRSLAVELSDCEFTNDPTPSTVQIRNYPPGVTYSLSGTSADSTVTINLNFTGEDFDVNYPNFYVWIDGLNLTFRESVDSLNSNQLTITAENEPPVANLTSTPSSITEANINGAVLHIELDQETFNDTMDINEFTLVNEPIGTSLTGFAYLNDQQVDLTISHNGTDFDDDINDFAVIIKPDFLTISGDDLQTGNISIDAEDEPAVASFIPDSVMHEYSLDRRYLTVTIQEDTFLNLGSRPQNEFELDNKPSGLVIGAVTVLNKNQARLDLDFTYNDFDNEISGFRVVVKPDNLMKRSTDLNTENSLTIAQYVENPVADAAEDAEMIEFTLDNRYVDIALDDEWFPNTDSVFATDFTLLNEPDGLEVQGIASISKYAVRLNLQFDGTDFDTPIDDFRISIDKDVLIQSDADLVTDAMSIEPTHEPEITGVNIPDQIHKVGDVVTATIDLDVPTDLDTTFTLVDGAMIGVYTLGNLTRDITNFNTYYATFTIPEGGTDYAAGADIPVSDLQLKDGVIFGNIWNTPISNDNDLIDANTPEVISMTVVSQGGQKIGDKVLMVVIADEEGYSLDNSSVINSSSNISIEGNPTTTYTLGYTVTDGDDDVAQGNLTVGIVFRDEAGNTNDPFTIVSDNNVIIDANPPVIDSIRITSADTNLIIGETLEITVYSDSTDYSLEKGSTTINGVEGTEGNINFSELSGGEYLLTYSIEEGDNEVTSPGLLAVSIVMADTVGNVSAAETELSNNNVTILSTRPTASLAGTQQICLGDTAELNITFTGVGPWDIDYFDETTTNTIFGINENPYYFPVITESAGQKTYTVTYVVDATGNNNTGTGSAYVQVFDLPDVEIVGLGDKYSVETPEVPLTGIPAHIDRGEFKGVGVNQKANKSYYFSPSEAGTEGSPHRIYYIYEDINGCVNTDSSDVKVLSASADIYIGPDFTDLRSMACWYEDEFIISAENTADSIGSFTTDPYYPGFLTDNDDNTATLNPSAIDWISLQDDQTVNIVYHFRDNLNTDITEQRELEIEYFQTPRILGLDKTEYCSNETLFDLEGSYETGVFTIVQGVGGDLVQGYTFNPATANLGSTWITYTQQETAECVLKDSVELIVHPSPIADFEILGNCIAETGSWIQFDNTTDTATHGLQMESWYWEFGDYNIDTVKNPTHFYQAGGSRTVTLTATTIHNCEHTKEQVYTFGAQPKANFTWNTECFTGDDIQFRSLEESDDPISEYTWRVFNMDSTLLHSESGATLKEFEYGFATRDEYPIDVTVLTERNCHDSYRDTILLRPYMFIKATEDPYFEDFEADPPGWYSSGDEINAYESWTFNPVTAGIFPGNASSGDHAWYTEYAYSDSIEQSWISSPCFNLKETRRPMIQMNIKRSMERDRDGAVLQYTADNGKTWNNVGTLDDGSINWFNSFRITTEPGGQEQGWTGDFIFTADQDWVIAKHELDELRQYPVVQFRIGYGSYGKSEFENNKGFAFDDIWIGERSRLVLLEHFTNAGDELSMQSNTQVNDLVDDNNMDIIDIKYHVGVPGPDKMYDDYPIGPSARSLYYGISNFPQSFMDGGGETGTYRYNYKGTNLNELDLFTRVLDDPSFDITLDAVVSGGQVSVDVTVEALEDLAQASYTVHIAVIEKEISDAGYVGGSGLVFQNVVKQMLPDAGGSIFTRSWTTGDQESVSSNWSFENVLNEEMIYVVAFVQNRETKLVYQAVTDDPDANATSIESYMASKDKDILVYPNPSADHAFIAFGKPVLERTELKVYNHAGALIEIHRIKGGLNVYQLNVSDYKKGVYYIRVTDQMKVVGTAKLIVL